MRICIVSAGPYDAILPFCRPIRRSGSASATALRSKALDLAAELKKRLKLPRGSRFCWMRGRYIGRGRQRGIRLPPRPENAAVSLTINDATMTSDQSPHTARQAPRPPARLGNPSA